MSASPPSSEPVSIFWFRQDLRLADNPGLTRAARAGKVLAIYILEPTPFSSPEPAGTSPCGGTAPDGAAGGLHHAALAPTAMGAAARVWTHHSLAALNTALGGKLNVYKGEPAQIIGDLVRAHAVSSVFWSRCYEPWRIARDQTLKAGLKALGVPCESVNASLLWEPWEVLKSDRTPYKVFTPFYRKGCLHAAPPRPPLPVPENLALVKDPAALDLGALNLLPKTRWDNPLASHWEISEKGAQARLADFLESGLEGYKTGRDFPARNHASRLSPYLHSGEISPHQVWHAVHTCAQSAIPAHAQSADSDHFCAELGWREFSYSLLYHFPALAHANWQPKFDAFPWRQDPAALQLWQQGQTGYPLVDAGMRELWQTGYMHNRIRMVVASFLVKNLLIDWRHGARWFWECLVDADLANNSASWQWVAGSGADAAPYFRVFNPVSQGQKFDETGAYTRRFVPELARVPDKYLFAPWQAPADILAKAGVVLGQTYPAPMVDAAYSRARALAAFATLGARLETSPQA